MSATPGPWVYVPKLSASENHKGFFVRAEKSTNNGYWALADVQPGDEDGRVGEANARLIAAAPELLAALQAIVALDVGDKPALWHFAEEFDAARAAITKATGATP